MKIDEIKPYEKNARYNAKAIPIVAESIKEFGLKGQIVLESKENPVIVAGHTRWAACKSLGWSEIPDERIDYCEDLSEEQIKAYRLADNRTGEVATWNRALLKSEIKALGKVDMSKFSFDFKSKNKAYGAERLRTDRAYNLELCNKDNCTGKYDMPTLEPCDFTPSELLGFNFAKSAQSFNVGIHFFIDDYQFERLWNKPLEYIELLKKFDCVLTPDFSLYGDMALPMQQWNEYRRRALGNIWQRHKIKVIPTLSWADEDSFSFCFDGLPQGATVATSSVGVHGNAQAEQIWRSGMQKALSVIKPKTLLLYGGRVDGVNYGKTKVIDYKANTAFRK